MNVRKQRGSTSGVEALLQLIIYTLILARGYAVDNVAPVEAVMQVHGVTEYEITDKDVWFVGFRGCQIDEAAKFEVSITKENGDTMDVLVCTGWPFKGATIRSEW